MGDPWNVGSHRTRHPASGVGSRIILGVGVLRGRCKTVLNKPPVCGLAVASTNKSLAQMNKFPDRIRATVTQSGKDRTDHQSRSADLPRPAMAGAFPSKGKDVSHIC